MNKRNKNDFSNELYKDGKKTYNLKTQCCCNNKIKDLNKMKIAMDTFKDAIKKAETAYNWGYKDYYGKDSSGEYDWQCYEQAATLQNYLLDAVRKAGAISIYDITSVG